MNLQTNDLLTTTVERRTENEIDDITFISSPFSNPTENSLPGKSMDFDKTFKTLTETRHGDNLPLIRDGRKENVYFLVDNDNRSKTTKKQFTDDCGAWLKSSLKMHFYLISNFGNFEYIYKKQSIFFKRKNGKMVPLNPQPDLDSLVVLQR